MRQERLVSSDYEEKTAEEIRKLLENALGNARIVEVKRDFFDGSIRRVKILSDLKSERGVMEKIWVYLNFFRSNVEIFYKYQCKYKGVAGTSSKLLYSKKLNVEELKKYISNLLWQDIRMSRKEMEEAASKRARENYISYLEKKVEKESGFKISVSPWARDEVSIEVRFNNDRETEVFLELLEREGKEIFSYLEKLYRKVKVVSKI